MAQDVSTGNVDLEVGGGAEDVNSPPPDTSNRTDENDRKQEFADKLLHALAKNDASEVRKLLKEDHNTVRSEYRKFRDDCEEVKKKAEKREERRFHYDFRCSYGSNSSKQSSDEQNLNWIKILSNPMFIALEWQWRTNSDSECQFQEDVIDSSLLDAYLLSEMSSFKRYDSRDVYKKSAESYETFATDVLEEASQSELYKIMDVKGEGCLLEKDPPKHRNYIESLSFLKSAVNKTRKKFVSSPRCQAILDDVIFYEMRDWQDKNIMRAWIFLLCFFHIFVLLFTPFYIFFRSVQKIWCITRFNSIYESVEVFYEHPCHKVINYTICYVAFLSLLFASSFGFEHEYRTSTTGVSKVDWAVLIFLVGLLLQESWEAKNQGIRIYFSKWWNVVDAITIFTFVVAYTTWLFAWLSVHEEWKPRKNEFIVADVLYASAAVLAFFHLAHAFQISSTLGPLQLSLYRMLKDVAKFLLIFLLLFIAFGTGIVKVYSYYVVAQVKLREVNESQFQEYHPYAQHETTFIGLFWFLVGFVEEDKIHVDDHTFYLTQLFGRLGFIIYLICTTIVALNMLIAMMNNSFDRVMSDEDKEWKFSRTQMWLEYIDKGNAIPAPLNIIYYVAYVLILVPYGIKKIVCWIAKVCCGCKCKVSEPEVSEPEVSEPEVSKPEVSEPEVSEPEDTGNTFTYDFCICHESEDTGNTFTYDFSCICHGCSCSCKPIPVQANVVNEERLQAIRSSVSRYLNNRYPDEGTELKTSALASSPETDAGEGVRE